MPSPTTPVQIKAQIADPTSSVCGNMKATLLALPVLFYNFFNWMLNSDGSLSDLFVADISAKLVKPGDLIFSAAPLDVVGRLLCNGNTVPRATYPALFAVIGTSYGAGDGSTTFQLPNYQDRFPIGAGATYPLGQLGGEATHTLISAEIPQHTHNIILNQAEADGENENPTGGLFGHGANSSTVTDGGTGGGGAHNNIPPYFACFVYIKT